MGQGNKGFRQLHVWQKAYDELALEVYKISKMLPREETCGMSLMINMN